MSTIQLVIGSDHGGYEMKKQLIEHLSGFDHINFEDIGCTSEDIVRYPYYAARAAVMIQQGMADRGILLCSTGIGMSIAANKYRGIRAAHVCSSYQAKMTAAHNRSNILCLGGKCIGLFEAIDYIDTWLNTPYEGGRHDISLGLIDDLEKGMTQTAWNPGIPDTQ